MKIIIYIIGIIIFFILLKNAWRYINGGIVKEGAVGNYGKTETADSINNNIKKLNMTIYKNKKALKAILKRVENIYDNLEDLKNSAESAEKIEQNTKETNKYSSVKALGSIKTTKHNITKHKCDIYNKDGDINWVEMDNETYFKKFENDISNNLFADWKNWKFAENSNINIEQEKIKMQGKELWGPELRKHLSFLSQKKNKKETNGIFENFVIIEKINKINEKIKKLGDSMNIKEKEGMDNKERKEMDNVDGNNNINNANKGSNIGNKGDNNDKILKQKLEGSVNATNIFYILLLKFTEIQDFYIKGMEKLLVFYDEVYGCFKSLNSKKMGRVDDIKSSRQEQNRNNKLKLSRIKSINS